MSTHTSAGIPEEVSDLSRSSTSAGSGSSRLVTSELLSGLERMADFVAVSSSAYASCSLAWVTGLANSKQISRTESLTLSGVFALLFVLLLERHGDYKPYFSLMGVRETERILRASFESFALAMLAGYFLHLAISPLVAVLFILSTVLTVFVEKQVVHVLLTYLRNQGYGVRNAVILGTGSLGRMLYSALLRSPKLGLNPVVMVEENTTQGDVEIHELAYRTTRPARVLPGPISSALLRQLRASALIITDQNTSSAMLAELFTLTQRAGAALHFAASDAFNSDLWIEYDEIDGVVLGRYSGPTRRHVYELVKRAVDIVFSLSALVMLSPLISLIALMVKLSSPGPVMFRQQRVGRDGKIFCILKFRSMYADAEQYEISPSAGSDPRITLLGRLLRRASLDELPQLVNVLKGDMSLVGPRPEMPFVVEQYSPVQRRRLAVKPGITGLWQLSADRASVIHRNIEYDLYYLINNPRFVFDVLSQLSGLRRFDLSR